MKRHASALKRARQNEVRRARNKARRTRVRSAIKDFRSAIEEKQIDKAAQLFPTVVSVIQKTASLGTIHKRNAARKISRLAKQLNMVAAAR